MALGVVTLVCTRIPWLLIPVIISFATNSFITSRVNKGRREFFDEMSNVERGSTYYNTELQEPRYGKDVRLYGASQIFEKKYDEYTNKIYNTSKKYHTRFNRYWSLDSLLYTVCDSTIYIHSDNDRLIDLSDSGVNATNKACEIEFKNVRFKYPNTDKYILKNISVKIKAGEHHSIVGQNGAGKTTFIKLLCRLYSNYEGEIMINGKDARDYNFVEYIKSLSVVFQDFRLLAFTIKEKLTVFDDKDINLEETYKISGIDKWIESLDEKDQTYINKMFVDNGIEPSGGESQKLAIARALYKNASIVVLDEPTAVLDQISEYEIYKNFDKLVYGKTAIYISHRLSSCRFCDRIIVFNNGIITEEGSHEELMKNTDRLYYNMYSTRAKHYK